MVNKRHKREKKSDGLVYYTQLLEQLCTWFMAQVPLCPLTRTWVESGPDRVVGEQLELAKSYPST